MEACLRECESEVTKMAQVSFIKTKLGVTFPLQLSLPRNSHAPFLSFLFFYFFFLPCLSLSRSGQLMVDATVR